MVKVKLFEVWVKRGIFFIIILVLVLKCFKWEIVSVEFIWYRIFILIK